MVERKKLKLGVVVIQLNSLDGVQLVAGTSSVHISPEIPFSDIAIDYLNNLSNVLRKSKEYPNQVITADRIRRSEGLLFKLCYQFHKYLT